MLARRARAEARRGGERMSEVAERERCFTSMSGSKIGKDR
jgi:hypothetical protein